MLRIPRRFGLRDAALVVFGSAIVMAIYRDLPAEALVVVPNADPPALLALRRLLGGVYVVTPLMATVTLILLAMRLLPPRPTIRRLLRQPGMTACLGAAVVMGIDLAAILAAFFSFPLFGRRKWGEAFVSLAIGHDLSYTFADGTTPGHPDVRQVGLAIAAVWVVQALSGRWRATPDFLDRAGRFVGFVWIAMMLLAWCDGV